MLLSEKKNRDPFILIMSLNVSMFYIFRVVSLGLIPASASVLLGELSPERINNTLLFIVFATWSMFGGFISAKTAAIDMQRAASVRHVDINIKVIITVFIIILAERIFFGFFYFSTYGSSVITRMGGYVSRIFNDQLFIVAMFVVLLTKQKTISRQIYGIISILLIGYLVFTMFYGARGAMLTIGMAITYACLAVKQKVLIKKGYLLLIMITIIPASIFAFHFASYARSITDPSAKKNMSEFIHNVSEYKFEASDYSELMQPVFNRTGFLDYAMELIANREAYSDVINVAYYYMSIIDRLTPGFDVFGTPKASNCMRNVYKGYEITETYTSYQSDQFTLYGELYVLCGGYYSLLMFFIISWLFKRIYMHIVARDDFNTYFSKAILLYVYDYYFLNSFGMDWIVSDFIWVIISTLLIIMLVKIRSTCVTREGVFNLPSIIDGG